MFLRSLFTFYVLCSEKKSAGKDAKAGKLDVTNSWNGERATGNREPGTGVWELMYSGNPLENSKWRTKTKEKARRNNLGKCEFLPAVPPDGQYILVRADSD